MVFQLGAKIEVRSDEEGFVGVWYSAKIVHLDKAVSCTVEYDHLQDDRGSPLQEQALLKNIRPPPPQFRIKNWAKYDKVEAYDRDGWWTGIISRVVSKDMFLVYFRVSCEEIAFPISRIRCVLDWQDGKWLNRTQVTRLERQIAALTTGDSAVANKTKPVCKRKNPQIPRNCSSPKRKSLRSSRKPGGALFAQSDEAEASLEEQHDGSIDSGRQQEREEAEGVLRELLRMELTAYRWLLEALYSRGLNWKREVLLTDVRRELEISNREHAVVLEGVLRSPAKL